VLSPEEVATADAVSSQLVRLVRVFDRAHARYQATNPDALERATYHLLVHLVDGGPRRAGALAEVVHCDPSTVSRQVAQLVRLGLVERSADPLDGRATLLGATTQGRRVCEQNRRLRNERVAAILSGWVPAERTIFAELLTRFVDDVDGHPVAAAGRCAPAEAATA